MSGLQQIRTGQADTQNRNGTLQAFHAESFTKIADSLSEGENSVVENGEKIHHFLAQEVRFTPSILEFVDAYPGKQFSKKFTLQNVGRNPVLIRIGEPTSFVFLLKKPVRRNIFLASGASITRVVTYTYHSDDMVQKSRIPIHINGKQIDLPIIVKKASPQLEVSPPQIDFGTINMGSEVKTLVMTIYNVGGARTRYEIDVGKNDLDLVVNPMRGTIKAKHYVKVTVEIMGMKEGVFYKEIWIKTNELPIRIPILVEVVRPRLFVVYPNGTEELSAIDFPPTFIGTQKAVPFVLQNSSGEIALYITVGEVNGEYQFLNEARKNHNIFSFFSLTAEEGRLEPHECRVLTALFQPKDVKMARGWHHQEQMENKSQTEHVVFFSLNRVHCIERKEIEKACAPYNQADNANILLASRMKTKSSNMIKVNEKTDAQTAVDDLNIKESGFRLCLRGLSVKPEVLLQPSKLYIEQMCLGQTVQKVLTITNKSIIRVKCVNLKKVHVKVIPQKVWIGPGKVQEFSVMVKPTCAGAFHYKMKVQILAESDVVYTTDEPFKVIAEHTIGIFFKSVYPKKILQPKIGPGITPLITDEVGINKELATFGNADKVPFAAKLLALNEEFKPMWMRMNSAEMENTIMALPNDRPHGFQAWPKDKICRTIFKGWLRYAPPKDTLYTFPSKEQIVRTRQNDIWTNYLLMLREIREASNQDQVESSEVLSSYYMKKFQEHIKSDENQKLSMMGQQIKTKFPSFKVTNCLVPLSPIYLSHVFVEPKMINFGLVGVHNSTSALLKINNRNVSSIAITFMPGNSAVTVNEGTIIVHSASEKAITVTFKFGILGRYYGFLDYVINGSHQFKITISAFVTPMTLVVEPKSMLIGNYPPNKAFQPKSSFLSMENWVQASINYKLEFSADAPYYSLPEEGVIPPKSKLLSEVSLSLNPRKPLSAELKLISESGEKELLKVSQAFKKLLVSFLTNRIDLKDIPLNLKTKATAIIENECFHDVTFEVIDGSPMPGVTVEPKFGIIRARSFFPLQISIQIPVTMQFSFDIQAIVQTSKQLSVSVSGNVVLPDIRIEPSVINMRKICSHSFDIVTVCIENAGTTPSEVDIDFKSCPECSVISGNSHLYLNPKQATSVIIKFEPEDATRFVFYFPIIINNILGPPVMQEAETENVFFYLSYLEQIYDAYGEVHYTTKSKETIPLATFNCTVASRLINVTPKSIVFHHNKATQSPTEENLEGIDNCGGYLSFPPQSLIIANEGTNDVTFCIRNDDLGRKNDSPFDLEPVDEQKIEYRSKSMKATLRPGENLTFAVKFLPKKPGKYSVQVPVYVRGYNNGVVYCYISLSGELKNPNLIPEAEEIHFYPVPLNVSSELTFTITAENYYKPDVICCLICEPKEKGSITAQCLTTTWLVAPEVTELNGQQKFPIRITFKSSMPAALRCYLVFVDSSGNYCSILLTAIADNSSVTLYSLLNFSTSKYKIVRDVCTPPVWKADEHSVLFYPIDKGHLSKSEKPEQKSTFPESILFHNRYSEAVDRGPNLIIQGDLLTNNVGLVTWKKDPDESVTMLPESHSLSQVPSLLSTIRSLQPKRNFNKLDITYPNYPNQEDIYKRHCDNTLQYVERWIYEVVMRCDQYFMIPSSFRICKNQFEEEKKTKSRQQKNVVDFLSEIYEEAAIPRLDINDDACLSHWASQLLAFYNKILQMLESQGCFLPHVRAEYLLSYEDYLLNVQSDDYSEAIKLICGEPRANLSAKFSPKDLHQKVKSDVGETHFLKTSSFFSNKEWFSAKSVFDTYPSPIEADANLEKDDTDRVEMESHSRQVETVMELDEEFQHRFRVLKETEFNQRSTQAWLDIIIQIFRHSVLKKLVYKSTIPEVQVIEPGEKIPFEKMQRSQVSFYGGGKEPMNDLATSNLYSVQERMLLLWLNHHLNLQERHLWRRNSNRQDQNLKNKFISNFQKDLSDSLALISVTASYCPYVVPEYFYDCFPEPDTMNKICHNAARLVQAWRELNIGLTVETIDIVQPNNIFMVMLVAQLYEVLPELHPRYLICFEASLSSCQTKKFSVQTDLEDLIMEPKLLGEDSKYFAASLPSRLGLKKRKQDIRVTFSAKKIKRMRATLLLNGCVESPAFGKGLAFFLEGQLTELTESQKMSFSAPLYKVVCTEVPINPPYPESTIYEVWYSTVKPVLAENFDIAATSKPWSTISLKKLCRRLFLNESEVCFIKEEEKFYLKVTVACFTRKDRLFWLLFRSERGDFIVRIKIRTKIQKGFWTRVNCWYPDTRPTCSCPKTLKEPRVNWADLRSCPLISVIELPSRNADMWTALKTMFLKCLQPQEKIFWAQYFEKDIGLCILRWLLSPDEEEEVIDEFLPLLQTNITYDLTVFDSNKNLKMPPKIEIKDVRQEENFIIPIHVTEGAKSQTVVEMKSESEMEIRKFVVQLNSLKPLEEEEEEDEIVIWSDTCQPCTSKTLKSTPPPDTVKKSKKLAKLC